MLIEKYFAKTGLAICLTILNLGVLFILLGTCSENSGMHTIGKDVMIGALLLAFVSSVVYFR